ncbi:MAG: hypothetical protein A2175_02560 [Candidatus Nealsonbacteria bacterium RBG_13_42_11]|uniref:Tagatose-bisphosphate aldolase n=1 Tax=Candidatus Nealsonbacteria bacterium RBG_13_42_11 TaxID=1801663 RepID=A0A1G2DZW3_9BACT|nr:MAG: hypothetical protein A2175_02560 [Candidatus Nealsonbacteria bacterium RBG_13_42_11]
MPNKNLIFKILKKAQKEKFAVGQFNISNLETIKAIVQAAQKLKSPVIIGTSEGESKFIDLDQAVALIRSFREETGLPLFLNLDHGKSSEYIKEAVDSGYDAVHFDGSKLSLEENIKTAKEIVKYAHKKEILTEGEISFIGGASEVLEKIPEIKEEDLTDPEEALRFITETGVDSLAINVGTFHGVDVFGKKPHINLQRLKEIKNKVGDKVFLVLHGGSGVPEEDIKEAIESGIVKININTELRLAFTNTLKKILEENPKETTPYKYMPKVIEEVQKVVEEKIQLFGSANKI